MKRIEYLQAEMCFTSAILCSLQRSKSIEKASSEKVAKQQELRNKVVFVPFFLSPLILRLSNFRSSSSNLKLKTWEDSSSSKPCYNRPRPNRLSSKSSKRRLKIKKQSEVVRNREWTSCWSQLTSWSSAIYLGWRGTQIMKEILCTRFKMATEAAH